MIERNDKDEFVRVRCDTCGTPAPPNADIIINNGLIAMGWACDMSRRHVCPPCRIPPCPLAAE